MDIRGVYPPIPTPFTEDDHVDVKGMSEKPSMTFLVNAGIYLLEPSTFKNIPSGERYDMTQLIQCLIDEGRSIAAFPIHEYWIDIGQHSDYEQAQQHAKASEQSS